MTVETLRAYAEEVTLYAAKTAIMLQELIVSLESCE